ncbi:MAG: efflux RND transporter periplasmic adaptor subunit [Thalassolituus sp.]|jgi:cobalt-zinc-cadmium efflux system membrane fusion protein|uniref:efflux RND transporter periplasmic adaptor subunit n=1 Tax=Thalassolituus TaxID=187492 RepID=UPI00042DCF3E|nr:efflux RND transporter periplasmic adaptor subunit [Thalassolituus oleivorans]AHK15892.1 RND transporter [Thalassolituus oleivorans R6-15]APR67193.1 RND transporter [Thalassolituus oleivorans]
MISNTSMTTKLICLAACCLSLVSGQILAETDHQEEDLGHQEDVQEDHAQENHDEENHEHEEPDHEEHDEGHIELTQEQIQHSGISLATVTAGTIRDVLPVYGVIAINAERVQAVTARFDGIVRSVNKRIGDAVHKGDTLLTVEANESLRTYAINAAINGVVTERNINTGEHTTAAPLLVVQDLSTVWVDLSIFPKDAAQVGLGQRVRINNLDGSQSATGDIIYIAPLGQGANQAMTVRALIANPNGAWKPGLFINANITLAEVKAPLVVANSAVQIVEDKPVVFVQGKEGFEPRSVTLGRSDGEHSEVLAGLVNGDVYVSKNSFILKSELGKEDAEHAH